MKYGKKNDIKYWQFFIFKTFFFFIIHKKIVKKNSKIVKVGIQQVYYITNLLSYLDRNLKFI